MEHLFAGLCHGLVNDMGLKAFYVIDDFGNLHVIADIIPSCFFICQTH